MSQRIAASLFALLVAQVVLTASALPPPLPIEIQVVTSSPPASMAARQAQQIPAALIAENWFASINAPPRPELQRCATAAQEREACLRLSLRALAEEPDQLRVVLAVTPVDSIRSAITCISAGVGPADPAAQRVVVSVKRLLFAEPQVRQKDRVAVVRCILAAAGEIKELAADSAD